MAGYERGTYCYAESLRGERCAKPGGHDGMHVADLGGALEAWGDLNHKGDRAAFLRALPDDEGNCWECGNYWEKDHLCPEPACGNA